MKRWLATSSRAWSRSLEVLAKREAILRNTKGHGFALSNNPERLDARGPSVRLAKATARVREAIDKLWHTWAREDGVLDNISYDLRLSPDARQAYIYWYEESPLKKSEVNLVDIFGDARESGIQRYLERHRSKLRLYITRHAQFRYAPDIRIFQRHPQRNRSS